MKPHTTLVTPLHQKDADRVLLLTRLQATHSLASQTHFIQSKPCHRIRQLGSRPPLPLLHTCRTQRRHVVVPPALSHWRGGEVTLHGRDRGSEPGGGRHAQEAQRTLLQGTQAGPAVRGHMPRRLARTGAPALTGLRCHSSAVPDRPPRESGSSRLEAHLRSVHCTCAALRVSSANPDRTVKANTCFKTAPSTLAPSRRECQWQSGAVAFLLHLCTCDHERTFGSSATVEPS